MSKLNVLISHTSVYKQSGWGRIFPLALGLVKNGNKVTILTTNPNFSFFIKKEIVSDIEIIIFPEIAPKKLSRMGFGFLSLFFKIIHVLFNQYDVVHTDNGHRPSSGIPCRLHKRLHHSIYVAEWYDWYGKGGAYDHKHKLFKILFGWYELKYEIKDKKFADGVVVLSEVLKERAEQFKQPERIIKIHGGADVFSIPFLYDNSRIKENYAISQDILTLGYIDRTGSDLEEIMPIINVLSNFDLKTKIKIVQFGESNNIFKNISHEIRDKFILFGWIDFSKEYEKLQCVDVFFLFKEDVLTSKAGWPNCIGDYLACGRPILLNPVGEVIDFVKKYPFPFIVTSREEKDICAKIQYIIKNKEVLKEKGPSIRNLAEDVISWDSKSKILLDFYHTLLSIK